MTDLNELRKAAQVYSVVRAGIDPIVRPLGYLPEKTGPPTWAQEKSSGPKTAFWAQVNTKAVDSYSGGELLFEFERLIGRRTAAKLPGRARLDQLLVPSEMELMLAHQNALIVSLPRPPAEQVEAYPESLRETRSPATNKGVKTPGGSPPSRTPPVRQALDAARPTLIDAVL